MNSVLARMINNVYKHKHDVPNYEFVAETPTMHIYKRDASKIYVYAIRGWQPLKSEETADAVALLHNAVKDLARYKRDKQFILDHPAPPTYRVLGTGHSLGGAIMDQLIEEDIIPEAITFNPAVMPKDFKNKHNRRYYNRNDFIYKAFVLQNIMPSNVHIINNTWFDIFHYSMHFLDILNSYKSHSESVFITDPKYKSTGLDHVIQSVVLHKSKFEDVEHAKRWASSHGYKHAVDETPNEYRFRQVSPDLIKTGHYKVRSVPIGDIGYLVVLYN